METIQQDKTAETGGNNRPVMTASEFAAAKPQLPTLLTTKKALYYNFFPTQEQEDQIKVPLPLFLVEIRDVYAPSIAYPHSPWTIKKKLHCQEVATGNLMLRFKVVLDHVLRHWHTIVAERFVIDGLCISVPLLDLTEDNKPVRYENNDVFFYMLDTKDFVLACSELIRDRNLKANTIVFFYWDAKDMSFCFKSSQG